MSKVAVVYWSGTGNTEKMANAVVDGMKSAGGDVTLFTASEFGESKVDDFQAIAFGCPSMGDEVLEESEFEPMFDSVSPKLKGKKVGLFGSYGWGDGEWMRNWEDSCRSLGVTFVSDFVICQGEPDANAIAECENLGKKLTE